LPEMASCSYRAFLVMGGGLLRLAPVSKVTLAEKR
jgi:hypothetical protein